MRDVYLKNADDISFEGIGKHNRLRLRVISGSMVPLLKPGDYVHVLSLPEKSYSSGSLLVTKRKDGYLTHRLIGKDRMGWHTKGDRNRQADVPVEISDVVGMVIAVERKGVSHTLLTRFHITVARWVAWLSWREAHGQLSLTRWSAHFLSRILVHLNIWALFWHEKS